MNENAVSELVRMQRDLTAVRQRNAELEARCAMYRVFIFKFSGVSSIRPSLEWARKKADEMLLNPDNDGSNRLLDRLKEARWLIANVPWVEKDSAVWAQWQARRTVYLNETP